MVNYSVCGSGRSASTYALSPPFIYCNLNVEDTDTRITRVFPDAFDFLRTAEQQRSPVLVHGEAGCNRRCAGCCTGAVCVSMLRCPVAADFALRLCNVIMHVCVRCICDYFFIFYMFCSPTIVIAWLMQSRLWNLAATYAAHPHPPISLSFYLFGFVLFNP